MLRLTVLGSGSSGNCAVKTDAEGQVQWRGFPGWYEVTSGSRSQSLPLTKARPGGQLAFAE